jgi:hypothetical protein
MRSPKDKLRRISEADDLHISPFREDGVTLGTPTWIWSVAVDGDSYVRGYNGQGSRCYQAARHHKAGQITAASMTKTLNDRIDNAYRAKYLGSPYLEPMISRRAHRATIRIAPRETTTDRGARP